MWHMQCKRLTWSILIEWVLGDFIVVVFIWNLQLYSFHTKAEVCQTHAQLEASFIIYVGLFIPTEKWIPALVWNRYKHFHFLLLRNYSSLNTQYDISAAMSLSIKTMKTKGMVNWSCLYCCWWKSDVHVKGRGNVQSCIHVTFSCIHLPHSLTLSWKLEMKRIFTFNKITDFSGFEHCYKLDMPFYHWWLWWPAVETLYFIASALGSFSFFGCCGLTHMYIADANSKWHPKNILHAFQQN